MWKEWHFSSAVFPKPIPQSNLEKKQTNPTGGALYKIPGRHSKLSRSSKIRDVCKTVVAKGGHGESNH